MAGALAGGVNATLCYLRLPVPIEESAVNLHWHVIPAGCAHGALLALVAVAASEFARRRRTALIWCAVPFVAWLGGYLAWIPLDLSVSGRSAAESLAWPAEGGSQVISILWTPLPYFGAVAGLLYLSLLLARSLTSRWVFILAATAAGTLGSLWWWIEWGPWYFSLIHGTVWGSFVGLALSWRRRAAEQ
jgi:hypothetical protein